MGLHRLALCVPKHHAAACVHTSCPARDWTLLLHTHAQMCATVAALCLGAGLCVGAGLCAGTALGLLWCLGAALGAACVCMAALHACLHQVAGRTCVYVHV